MDFIITSFYSKGTGYKDLALRLQGYLEKINLAYDIQGIRNFGSWSRNCNFKPKFIRSMMNKHPGKAIVWVDADAVVHKWPGLFADLDGYDFACHFRDWWARKNELLSGTLWFAPNIRASALLQIWIDFIRHNPSELDQRNLQRALTHMGKEVKTYRLPIEYCTIFDDNKRRQIHPVIEHFQASRKLKRTVLKEGKK